MQSLTPWVVGSRCGAWGIWCSLQCYMVGEVDHNLLSLMIVTQPLLWKGAACNVIWLGNGEVGNNLLS